MLPVLTMPKFWIRQNSEYDRVLNMPALRSVLNVPKYALAEFWILSWSQICQNSEHGRVLNMQELHRVLNMSQYVWICLKRPWISLNMSEYAIMGRVLNMYQTIHSVRCLLRNRRIQNTVKNLRWSALEKYSLTIIAKNMILNFWEGSEYMSVFKYVRVLNIFKFL